MARCIGHKSTVNRSSTGPRHETTPKTSVHPWLPAPTQARVVTQ